jgi:predicted nuclease of predicted toxin-antitoxin system
MSRPRFLADEDLRGSIVRAVRQFEPEVEITTLLDLGLASARDEEVLDRAQTDRWLVVSHDVNTMKGLAERRIAEGHGIPGLFLVPQNRPTRTVAECLVLIWSASEFENWRDRVIFLPF